MSVEGKAAVITGGAQGIGMAVSPAFARAGAHVVVADIDEEGPKVRVNSISPGWIEVSDWKKAASKTTPIHTPKDLSQHPAGRVGIPGDIAEGMSVFGR